MNRLDNFKSISLALLSLFVYGYLLPLLVSSFHTELVIAGGITLVFYTWFVYEVLMSVMRKIKKDER